MNFLQIDTQLSLLYRTNHTQLLTQLIHHFTMGRQIFSQLQSSAITLVDNPFSALDEKLDIPVEQIKKLSEMERDGIDEDDATAIPKGTSKTISYLNMSDHRDQHRTTCRFCESSVREKTSTANSSLLGYVSKRSTHKLTHKMKDERKIIKINKKKMPTTDKERIALEAKNQRIMEKEAKISRIRAVRSEKSDGITKKNIKMGKSIRQTSRVIADIDESVADAKYIDELEREEYEAQFRFDDDYISYTPYDYSPYDYFPYDYIPW